MLPGNRTYDITVSNMNLVGSYLFPDNLAPGSELSDYEMGGLAIQDASQGLQVQPWRGCWNASDNTAYLIPDFNCAEAVPVFVEPGVVEFTFSFDQAMNWVAATRKADYTAKLYWYDTVTESRTITDYSDVQSIKLAHDDKRKLQINQGLSDVVFTYITHSDRRVRYRTQRERYLTEWIASYIQYPSRSRIQQFGFTEQFRMQWKITMRHAS